MRLGFYVRFALEGIRKNGRPYKPFALTCIGMAAVHYILVYLAWCEGGALGDSTRLVMELGGWVLAFFSGLFLLYTQSFLMRRRLREFGLYHVLGLGKADLVCVLFWETLFVAGLALAAGLALGAVLAKLAQAALLRLAHQPVDFALWMCWPALRRTAGCFGVIFALLFGCGAWHLRGASALKLLHSEAAGERPPRANWAVGALGAVLLAVAYGMAISIRDPIRALLLFFAAVLLVILATYLLLMTGSVALCRLLQKNRRYYYRAEHFVSVSSMAYRMRRNGAGLASICVIVTMVLVMISSTASLYFGLERSLRQQYPRQVNLQFSFVQHYGEEGVFTAQDAAALEACVRQTVEAHGGQWQNAYACRRVALAGVLQKGRVQLEVDDPGSWADLEDLWQFYFVPLEDYNAGMGTNEELRAGEALVYTAHGRYDAETISFMGGGSFAVKKHLDTFLNDGDLGMLVVPCMVLVVPDLAQALRGLDGLAAYNGERMIAPQWELHFDCGLPEKELLQLDDHVEDALAAQGLPERCRYDLLRCQVLTGLARQAYYDDYAGLFFLGGLLSLVFMLAAGLIIYYKQVCEGYEDAGRFAILQQVGMTRREIRRSIDAQLRILFFLPLGLAVCHLAFAFPMIRRLLLLFNMADVRLFAGATLLCAAAFALVYALIWRATSGAYYRIVTDAREAP